MDNQNNQSNQSNQNNEIDKYTQYTHYNQFKNEILNLIYGELPSYAYFYESNLDYDLEDGYWSDFTDKEIKKILIYFSDNYLDLEISEETIENEQWECKDVLIDLLMDYF
jgi:hypothetical protein